MQRIKDPTASTTLVGPPALTGNVGYFQPAVPGVSIATRLRYWYMTMIQEEIMSVLAAASVTADTTGTVFNQLLLSIQALISAVPHGNQIITSTASFTVPAGVFTVEAEIWAGGSGSWASSTTMPGGGGSGGGYARKRISGLTPGAAITVTIGTGGAAGTTAPLAPTSGTLTSFGAYISAAPGTFNPLGIAGSNPQLGNLAGIGAGGDLNLSGGAGATGNPGTGGGGMGGGGPLSGGGPNSGSIGVAGFFPGGGASGAGNPGSTAYVGAAGAGGLCIVRW
jgi:hypothetical protein